MNVAHILPPSNILSEVGSKYSIRDNLSSTFAPPNKRVLKNKVLILINGTMGMYENPLYENGTKELYEFLKQEKKKVVVCGGDGASSSKKYNFNPYYISTGGGASLNYLSGIELPALKIMED